MKRTKPNPGIEPEEIQTDAQADQVAQFLESVESAEDECLVRIYRRDKDGMSYSGEYTKSDFDIATFAAEYRGGKYRLQLFNKTSGLILTNVNYSVDPIRFPPMRIAAAPIVGAAESAGVGGATTPATTALETELARMKIELQRLQTAAPQATGPSWQDVFSAMKGGNAGGLGSKELIAFATAIVPLIVKLFEQFKPAKHGLSEVIEGMQAVRDMTGGESGGGESGEGFGKIAQMVMGFLQSLPKQPAAPPAAPSAPQEAASLPTLPAATPHPTLPPANGAAKSQPTAEQKLRARIVGIVNLAAEVQPEHYDAYAEVMIDALTQLRVNLSILLATDTATVVQNVLVELPALAGKEATITAIVEAMKAIEAETAEEAPAATAPQL